MNYFIDDKVALLDLPSIIPYCTVNFKIIGSNIKQ